jgi:cobalt/nickel transport system permease protein
VSSESFLAKNIASVTGTLETVILTESTCRVPGLLQGLDPRIKLLGIVLLIVSVGLVINPLILGIMFCLVFVLSLLSGISPGSFLKRVFLFVPVFTLVIAIPALFLTHGVPLVQMGNTVLITEQGARSAVTLFLRVTDSISLGVLLIMTTSWINVLAALRCLHLPSLFVDVLGMTYRYIFLLLHNVNIMFLARRSRTVGTFSGGENRRWLTAAISTTMAKSQQLSEEVYLAMLSRGYHGEMLVLDGFKMRKRDLIWAGFIIIAVAIFIWSNYLWK